MPLCGYYLALLSCIGCLTGDMSVRQVQAACEPSALLSRGDVSAGPRAAVAAGHIRQVSITLSPVLSCRLLSCPEVMSQQGHVLQSLLVTFVK